MFVPILSKKIYIDHFEDSQARHQRNRSHHQLSVLILKFSSYLLYLNSPTMIQPLYTIKDIQIPVESYGSSLSWHRRTYLLTLKIWEWSGNLQINLFRARKKMLQEWNCSKSQILCNKLFKLCFLFLLKLRNYNLWMKKNRSFMRAYMETLFLSFYWPHLLRFCLSSQTWTRFSFTNERGNQHRRKFVRMIKSFQTFT